MCIRIAQPNKVAFSVPGNDDSWWYFCLLPVAALSSGQTSPYVAIMLWQPESTATVPGKALELVSYSSEINIQMASQASPPSVWPCSNRKASRPLNSNVTANASTGHLSKGAANVHAMLFKPQ